VLAGAAALLSMTPRPSAPVPAARRAAVARALPQPHGPAWPPTDEELAAIVARDLWVHPLPGPERYMPVRDSRVFGAERPGERPAECRSGHCGVDIGSEWGLPVLAAHDGVVDRVQRGPNEDHGGKYVRLAHRGGTVFTQYFHLAAIPSSLEVGQEVRAGQLVGLLGDSGVRNSGPHLHFTISVKPAADVRERYIDPEPLIALWPVAEKVHRGAAGHLSTEVAAGLPLGARGRIDRRRAAEAAVAARAAPRRRRAVAGGRGRGEEIGVVAPPEASAAAVSGEAAGTGLPADPGATSGTTPVPETAAAAVPTGEAAADRSGTTRPTGVRKRKARRKRAAAARVVAPEPIRSVAEPPESSAALGGQGGL
jgi:hypothetical protein